MAKPKNRPDGPGGGGGPTGGGGSRGGGGKPRKQGKTGRLRQRATADIQTAYQPQLDELQRLVEAQQAQAENYQRSVASLYGGLGPQLAQISGQYEPQIQGIQDRFTGAVGGLADLLGTSTPAGEQAAAGGLLGNIGGGGLQLLASQAARNAGYGASAQRQAAIDPVNYQANILQQLQNYMTQAGQQRSDIASQMPGQIVSHLGELRDQERQYQLAQQEYELRQGVAQSQMANDRGLLTFAELQAQDALDRRKNPPPGGSPPGGPPRGTDNPGGPPGGQQGLDPRLVHADPSANVPRVNPVSAFVSGNIRWKDLGRGQRRRVRRRITSYPLPSGISSALGQATNDPRDVIRAVRRYYHPPRRPPY